MNNIFKKMFLTVFIIFIIPVIGFCGEKPNALSKNHISLFASSKLILLQTQQTKQAFQSTGPVFLKSLLLPGWGQLSSGAKTRARAFLIAEGFMWSAFTSFKIYKHLKENDLENFAVQNAGVNGTGKEKPFYTDVSNYIDIFEHNEEMRRFRRYDDVYEIDEDHFWQWKSEKDKDKFDELRLSSSQSNRNATLVLGTIIVNHVISGIDAIFAARRLNFKISSHLNAIPTIGQSGDVRLKLSLSASL